MKGCKNLKLLRIEAIPFIGYGRKEMGVVNWGEKIPLKYANKNLHENMD